VEGRHHKGYNHEIVYSEAVSLAPTTEVRGVVKLHPTWKEFVAGLYMAQNTYVPSSQASLWC